MDTLVFILQQTLFFAVPLLIVALGAMYSQKSGVTNIAMEGIMTAGAFFGILVIRRLQGNISGQMLFVLAMLAGAAAGLAFAFLHAVSAVKFMADQTISGTAINMFAPAMCIFLSRILFGAKWVSFIDTFFIEKVPLLSKIPLIGPVFFTKCYISTFFGIALLLLLDFLLKKTRFGLRLSACGENPEAAASAGIDVIKMRYTGVLISGLLGGAGGVIFVVPSSTVFSGTVAGYGFLALAVLILGRWKPMGILAASSFFGVLKALSSSYSGIPFLAALPVSSEIYKMVPYVLTLVVLAFSSGRSEAPKAAGKPYDDGKTTVSAMNAGKWSRRKIIALTAAFVLITAVIVIFRSGKELPGNMSPGIGAEVAIALPTASGIDDKSICQSEWEGITQYTTEHGITRKYFQSKEASEASLIDALEMAQAGGAKVIIGSTYELLIPMYVMQDEYPETTFITVDGLPQSPYDNSEYIAPNTAAILFAEQESGFLAGYAAVMDGYRSLGYIGGAANPAVIRYGYGYVAGAEAAAQKLGLKPGDISIRYNYSGTFEATPEVLSMASSWYMNGTEVIFACGGALIYSVMKAAETSDGKVIGVDTDQTFESPTVITSALKRTDIAVYDMLDKFYSGTLQYGRATEYNVKNGGIGLPMETSRFSSFSSEQYEEILAEIASGSIDIPRDTDAASADLIPLEIVTLTLLQ